LKNRATRAAKKMKKSERRCMIDDDIDDCDCERLRDNFTTLRTEYQEHHGRAYDYYRMGIEEAIKTDPRSIFVYVDLKKKRVGYPWVMNFEDQSASESQEMIFYDLFGSCE
jgi:hypothetical protein